MRCFVAVEIPPPSARVAWPREPERHLTLRFLGEIDESGADRARRAIDRAVRGRAPFSLTLHGAGVFPDRTRPRVLWIGIGEGAAEIGELERSLSSELAAEGFPAEERPYVPHVTVFRIREKAEADQARAFLREVEGAVLGAARVEAVVLFESRLTPHGAEHRALHRASLGGAPGPPPVAPA